MFRTPWVHASTSGLEKLDPSYGVPGEHVSRSDRRGVSLMVCVQNRLSGMM